MFHSTKLESDLPKLTAEQVFFSEGCFVPIDNEDEEDEYTFPVCVRALSFGGLHLLISSQSEDMLVLYQQQKGGDFVVGTLELNKSVKPTQNSKKMTSSFRAVEPFCFRDRLDKETEDAPCSYKFVDEYEDIAPPPTILLATYTGDLLLAKVYCSTLERNSVHRYKEREEVKLDPSEEEGEGQDSPDEEDIWNSKSSPKKSSAFGSTPPGSSFIAGSGSKGFPATLAAPDTMKNPVPPPFGTGLSFQTQNTQPVAQSSLSKT